MSYDSQSQANKRSIWAKSLWPVKSSTFSASSERVTEFSRPLNWLTEGLNRLTVLFSPAAGCQTVTGQEMTPKGRRGPETDYC